MEVGKGCRRCSVVRVNLLCRFYDQGFREKERDAVKKLEALVRIARMRGYAEGTEILFEGLAQDFVRKVCWNISSLLTEEDLLHVGVKTDGQPPS